MTDTLMDQASEAKRTALGTLLIERGYIDQEQLDEALRRSAENGERLGEVIVKLGWASEDDLAKVLAEQWHLRYFERSAISFDGKALRRMSWEDASRLEALPIQENDQGDVVVAVAEPTDARLLALRELLGDRIDFVVVAKTAIETGLRSELLSRDGSSVVEVAPVDETPEVTDEVEEFEAVDSEDEGNGQFKAYEAMATTSPFGPEVVEPAAVETSQMFVSQLTDVGGDSFDEVARSLSDGLSSQLASLRSIVVEAETRRENDRVEIESLRAAVAERDETIRSKDEMIRSKDETITSRDETIRSAQQQLREFADSLEQNSTL